MLLSKLTATDDAIGILLMVDFPPAICIAILIQEAMAN